MESGKFIVKCDYEDRDYVKDVCTWSNKYRAWTLNSTLMNYEIAKSQRFVEWVFPEEIDSLFQSKLKLNLDFQKHGFKSKTPPYKHQVMLTNLVLERERCFFLCGVGTGKSKAVIDAISELHYRGDVKRALIVSPASIMKNFQSQIEEHSYLESTVIEGSLYKRIQLLNVNTPVHIINYEMLSKLSGRMPKYDMVVFDECHRLKNRQALQSKAALKLSKGVRYKVGLTGTLFSNSFEDVFMPYKIISPHVFGPAFNGFKDSFLVLGGFNNHQVVGYINEHSFRKLLSTNSLKFELDDIVDLPPEIEVIKKFNLNDKNSSTYSILEKEFVILAKETERMTANVLERLIRLSQITSGFTLNNENEIIDIGNEKLSVLEEVLLETSGKIIVWCRFTHSIKRVEKLCEKLNLSCMTYFSETKDKSCYKQFNSDDTRVFIAQIQTGIGYSIPNANTAIFYETDYSRVNHVQAKGRNRRLVGSENKSVVYIYLQAESTLDESIFRILKQKDFNARDALRLIQGGK